MMSYTSLCNLSFMHLQINMYKEPVDTLQNVTITMFHWLTLLVGRVSMVTIYIYIRLVM